MGERENLVGVIREARRAVPEPSSLRSEIDNLVPELGEAGGVPDIDAALAALAHEAPPADWAYRRLLVMAALGRAIAEPFERPEWQGPDRQKAVAALRPSTREGSRRQAEELYAHLCKRSPQVERDPDVAKRTLLATAFARQLIVVVTDTKTSTVEGPGRSARARLRVAAAVPGYALADVAELLEPTTWQQLSGGRITMRPHPAGELEDKVERLYYEVFQITTRLKLTPRLRVKRQPRVTTDGDRRAQWLEYRLAETQSPGELVTRDEGSIVIRETDDGVRIATTKRVLLTPPFDAPSLAMQADALGYFDAFEDMIRVALATPGRQRAA